MKAKVIKRFRDRITKKVFEKNNIYEGTEERVNEIREKGYLGENIEDDLELETILEAAKTHADLDGVIKELKLDGIPSKRDGATIDERKQAILAVAEKLAAQTGEGE